MSGYAFFQGYVQRAAEPRAVPLNERPRQVDPDVLPFRHLGGRRFEILCYRVKSASSTARTVQLMQGTGDGGMDVVSYDDGRVVSIVQCKNTAARVSLTVAVEELTKLALHHFLEPNILHQRVDYEIWSPMGFSGDAATLINTWPEKWTEARVRSAAKVLLRKPTFSSLQWSQVRQAVLHDFRSLIKPKCVEGVDITLLVREHPIIEDDFFAIRRAASIDDIRQVMSEAGWCQINSEEVKYLSKRIEAFQSNERLQFLGTSVFGVTPEVVARFTKEELERFTKVTIESLIGTVEIVHAVANRRCAELAASYRGPEKGFFPFALRRLLELHVLCRVKRWMLPGDLRRAHLQFIGEPLEDQVHPVAEELWRFAMAPDGPKGAVNPLRGILQARYLSFESFKNELIASFLRERATVLPMVSEIDRMLPAHLMIVSEAIPSIEDESVLRRFAASMEAIKNAKPVAPEGT